MKPDIVIVYLQSNKENNEKNCSNSNVAFTTMLSMSTSLFFDDDGRKASTDK